MREHTRTKTKLRYLARALGVMQPKRREGFTMKFVFFIFVFIFSSQAASLTIGRTINLPNESILANSGESIEISPSINIIGEIQLYW